MTNFIGRLTTSIRKHAEYRRTVEALKGVPAGLAEDMNIYPGLEKSIARRAVYGF